MKSYCVKPKKKETECTQPSGYKKEKNERAMFWCICAECGIKKTRFVSNTMNFYLKGNNIFDRYNPSKIEATLTMQY